MGDDDMKTSTVSEKTVIVSSDNDSDDIVYPTGFKLVIIVGALCLAVLLVALDQTIIVTAIPKITDRFNSVNDIGWYGSVSA
jgi:hypothetical protein